MNDIEFRKRLIADLQHVANADEMISLQQDLERWCRELNHLDQETEGVLSRRRLEIAEARNQSMRIGPQVKQDYFELEVVLKRQIAASRKFLLIVRERKMAVKAMIKQRATDNVTAMKQQKQQKSEEAVSRLQYADARLLEQASWIIHHAHDDIAWFQNNQARMQRWLQEFDLWEAQINGESDAGSHH